MLEQMDRLVLIKGAGDLASGIAVRLRRCGFAVVMTELAHPLMVRRPVCFGEAIYEGRVAVEGIEAQRAGGSAEAQTLLAQGTIPILVDPAAKSRHELIPAVLVDAIMAKRNTGTSKVDAPLVIALGPGFSAGVDCHAVIETHRGHWLGRVIWQGAALADTGVPGEIGGHRSERVLRAPVTGLLTAIANIGDRVVAGQVLATVDADFCLLSSVFCGQSIRAGCNGVLRGMIRSGLRVTAGLKVGDVDPRAEPDHCFTVSDKSLAIAGGVLEAILSRSKIPCLSG